MTAAAVYKINATMILSPANDKSTGAQDAEVYKSQLQCCPLEFPM